jgi:hypothetical protein
LTPVASANCSAVKWPSEPTPEVPTLNPSGLALAFSISSRSVLTPSFLLATRAEYSLCVCTTGTTSESFGAFGEAAWAAAKVLEMKIHV